MTHIFQTLLTSKELNNMEEGRGKEKRWNSPCDMS